MKITPFFLQHYYFLHPTLYFVEAQATKSSAIGEDIYPN
jgi:hypothetical protein